MEVIMMNGYRRFPSQACAEIGCAPNTLWHCAGECSGALEVRRGRLGDFAIGVKGLEYIRTALASGRITKALVVLTGDRSEVIASAELGQVLAAIGDASPIFGTNGYSPYYWVTERFDLVSLDRPY
jgi:hypothetical protein